MKGKGFDRLRYQLDKLSKACPAEVSAFIEQISESDGALKANSAIISSLECSPLSDELISRINARIKSRGRISQFDISTVNLLIRIQKHFGKSTEKLEVLRRKWTRKATKADRQRLKMHAGKYRKVVLDWLQYPAKGRTELRDKAIFTILIFIPLRLSTLAQLRKVDFSEADGVLFIRPEIMKNRKAVSPRLPQLAIQRLKEYLAQRNDNHEHLFIGSGQRPISIESLQTAIRRRAHKILGESVGPHDFQRIVATTSSETSQELAAALLVVSPAILRKHYDLRDDSDKINQALRAYGGAQ